MINVNTVVLSDKVPYNNGKEWRYILGYQVDGKTIIPLFIKTLKNIFSYGVSQYDKNSAYTMSFKVSGVPEWVLQYRNTWNEVDKLTTEPIKREGTYMHGKLKSWKEHIMTYFYGQDVPHDMYCKVTAKLEVDSVHKQSKNYHPQVYVQEWKYTDAKSQQRRM